MTVCNTGFVDPAASILRLLRDQTRELAFPLEGAAARTTRTPPVSFVSILGKLAITLGAGRVRTSAASRRKEYRHGCVRFALGGVPARETGPIESQPRHYLPPSRPALGLDDTIVSRT